MIRFTDMSESTHIDHGNQEGEEAKDMEGQDEEFQLWQKRAGVHIDKYGEGHDSPVEQCTLPCSPGVARVIHRDEGQDQVSGEICAAGDKGLPAAYNKPTCSSSLQQRASLTFSFARGGVPMM